MEIDYTVQIWREGDQFVARAMPLDVASAGPSPEEARAAVHEAVRLFLQTAHEHGTLEEVLGSGLVAGRPAILLQPFRESLD